MRIFLLGDASRPGTQGEAEQLLPFLKSHCEVVVVDFEQERDLDATQADMAIVLGGDGAILRAAHQMGYRQTPVLGINFGKLGFLADLNPDDVRACFAAVVKGNYRVTSHLMFECTISSPQGSQTFLGLNEVAIHNGPPFRIIDLELSLDGEPVSRFLGDGIIISTPIGSTAHSLSAGGPILGQELDAFVITPICPHTLLNRPVVESADKVYSISFRRTLPATSVVIDGQEIVPVTPEHRVTVKKAPVCFRLVKVAGHSYFQTLRDKLRWGTGPNYRQDG
jgi:NAD+ kinase